MRRPDWMLLAMALPMAVAPTDLTYPALSHLADATLTALYGSAELSGVRAAAVRMAVSLLIPTALVFGLLSLTRLGVWLAPNRLVLTFALLFDGLILIVATGMLSLDGRPLSQWHGGAGRIIEAGLWFSLVASLALLALSTLWHRMKAPARQRTLDATSLMWKEV